MANRKCRYSKSLVWIFCCLMMLWLTACSDDDSGGTKKIFDTSEYAKYIGTWEEKSVEIEGNEMSGEELPSRVYIMFFENKTASIYSYLKNSNKLIQQANQVEVECDENERPQTIVYYEQDGFSHTYYIGEIGYNGTMSVSTHFTNDDYSEMVTEETYVKIANETDTSVITSKKETTERAQKKVCTESELKDIVRKDFGSGWAYWYYDDFNYDGEGEAFVIYGDLLEENYYQDVVILLLTSSGECQTVAKHYFMNLFTIENLENERKFLTCELIGGSGSVSYIYSVTDEGNAYEPEISGKVQEFRIWNMEPYCTDDDYSAGYHEYVDMPLYYDKKTGEFRK